MKGNNKKKAGSGSGTMQARAHRPWLILLFIGPAVFLLLYWLTTMRAGIPPEVGGQVLPTEFRTPGEVAVVDDKSFRAGDIYTGRELRFANNTVMADTGYVFAVIPVKTPQDYDLDPDQWWLLDNKNARYDLLKVTAENPVQDPNRARVESESNIKYGIFKIPKETGECYLVFKNAAWRYHIK